MANKRYDIELNKPRSIAYLSLFFCHILSLFFCLLHIPKTNCKTLGDRAFAHAAPQLWNSLPLDVRNCENISVFKKRLKTFLFNKAYNSL